MYSWIHDVSGPLTPEQQEIASGLAAILERLQPPLLDPTRSTAARDDNSYHVTLAHQRDSALQVDVDAAGYGEIVVSYGVEHEHFRSEDAEVGRVWPFPSENHVAAALALVEFLLTGRIELHVWKRPLAVKTHSYWISDAGQREVFMRGATVGPIFGWSREPQVYLFDYTTSQPRPS